MLSTLPRIKKNNNTENVTILHFDVEIVLIILISNTPLKWCFEDCEDC